MKKPNAILLLSCVLAFAAAARAGIVLDDAPSNSVPIPPANSLAVPKPSDAPATPEDKSPPVPDMLFFANKDSLHGAFLGIDRDGLHWQSPLAEKPIVFQTANLASVVLHPREIALAGVQPLHNVLLANGDLLAGDVVSLDDKSLLLDTRYAGRLTIPRSAVKSINAAAVLYRGPAGADDWINGPDAGNTGWNYQDGALSAGTGFGTIGRDLKLPATSRVEFDLTTSGNAQLNIYICSDHAEKPGDSYMFQANFNPSSQIIDFARYSPERANMRVGDQITLSPDMVQADKNHFDIRINKEAKVIWLYINGRVAERYTHLDDLAKMGSCLIFSPGFAQAQGVNMRISKIKVSSWDGGDMPTGDTSGSNEDTIKLPGQAAAHGTLKSIAGGKAVLATAEGDREMPFAQCEWIRFSPGGTAEPKKGTNDVRAYFLSHGSVTMEIESWDAKQITASSPNFGNAVFTPGLFRRLQYNPYSTPAPTDDNAADVDDKGDDE